MKITFRCQHCGNQKEINTSQSRGKYCSNRCQHDFQKQQIVTRWLNGDYDGVVSKNTVASIANAIREYLIGKTEGKCVKCKQSLIHPITEKSGLQIHHKDGNALNNNEKNLEVLCPNCHWLTSNFGNMNKNSFRKKKKIVYV